MPKGSSWSLLSFRVNVPDKEAIGICLIKRNKLPLKKMSVLFNTNLISREKEAN